MTNQNKLIVQLETSLYWQVLLLKKTKKQKLNRIWSQIITITIEYIANNKIPLPWKHLVRVTLDCVVGCVYVDVIALRNIMPMLPSWSYDIIFYDFKLLLNYKTVPTVHCRFAPLIFYIHIFNPVYNIRFIKPLIIILVWVERRFEIIFDILCIWWSCWSYCRWSISSKNSRVPLCWSSI